ncbi:serine hydrolase [Paenibacillus sp. 2003]|uniref:serine hydrolase n=1 Tax=Paenibacillus TaxID=44249 RepID=UPI00285CC2CA|nr:serine hydrolase [Paenibacillus sp. 2003]MDR6718615.1 CubicO group peptidase (beta-lactamase class C family) [Paenibacillus sp. 2003]
MKKAIRNASLAVLLLSASIVTACTATNDVAASNQKSIEKVSLEGPKDSKEVEAFANAVFADKMKEFNTVGSNFVVVKDGKVLLSKGYGYADREKKIPVDKDTVFQIGSVTKSFTALAAMQLVDQGKIDLKHDIQEYLGGMKVPNKTGKPLTMFDLLTYTSGVDLPDIVTDYSVEYLNKDISMKGYLHKNMPTVVRTPGEVYTYDNFGFMLAGYAVENVSGMSYSQYMEKNIFKPLGMDKTSVRLTPEVLSNMAAHYGPSGELQPTMGTAPSVKPEGSMTSTGEDMAKYLIMHLNKGEFEGKEIVSKQSVDLMQTYQFYADPTIPITTVGFEGYFNNVMNGQHVILKGGNVPGHSSLIAILPEKNTAFYLSYNNDSMMSLGVYEAFMNHYFPKTVKTQPSTYSKISKQTAQAYVGLYRNTRLYGVRTKISYADGNLLMETGTTGKHTLRMIHPLLFEDESGNKMAFKKDKSGDITYFYYTNPQGMDFVAHAQKVKMKTGFSDVPNGSVYKSYIDNLNSLDIMGAKSGNRFDPKGKMTQGEFADVLLRAHGMHTFPDEFRENKKRMIAGIPHYQPKSLITRQMAAVMIQNLKHAAPGTNVKLIGKTDSWAVDAITALVSQGIVDPDTKINSNQTVDFRSTQTLSRQEASALLDKAFDYYTLPIKP